ncbi:hypothetical protein ABBQ32_005739 [Trebouxia sp. C0010 RCD-2024]
MAKDQITPPMSEPASHTSRTHAEAEFAAFSASAKRFNVCKAKLPPLGAESSWPHGVGTKPVSESSTDAVTSLASCKSVAWATNATAAAILRSNSPCPGQSRMLPSNASSSPLSTMLASHGRLKGRISVTPTSWQELIALSNKAKAGQAGMHVDTTEAYSSKTAAEVPPDAKLTDQEENLLRQFLSPQVLRKRHQLADKEVARLYRILHIYSLGFHQVVAEVTLHAAQRQSLLLAIWKALSQLWQDALQVSFADEVAQLIQERDSLAAACATAQDAAADMQQQNRELQERLRSLVGGAISRMTREKASKDHIAGLERQLHLLKEKEAQMTGEIQAQHAQQSLQQASIMQAAAKPQDAGTRQAALRKATRQELPQAEAAVEAKQVLLRQAYKQATEAEAQCKQLHLKLHDALEHSRALASAYHNSQRQAGAAVKELRAKRTAYELVHADWLASQEELKAHRHVLSRLDAM